MRAAVPADQRVGGEGLHLDPGAAEPTDVIQLANRDRFVWHAHVQELRPGQLYGYKISGDYRPEWGFRFNDAVLRHLTVKKTKAETGPSAMMKRVEKEEARKTQQETSA